MESSSRRHSRSSVASDLPSNRHTGNQIVNELAQAFLDEKRRSRRWSIFFRFLLVLLLIAFFLLAFGSRLGSFAGIGDSKHTAVVEINGAIGAEEAANADAIVDSLEQALQHRHTAGVILRINSPGGSPVQSGIVFDEIIRLRNEYPTIPIHAVVGDICASGGYYIASAADRIYADKASIVGSIGVRMDSFGFQGALEKLGVERRLLTSGENKALLDPFLPSDPAQVEHMEKLLKAIHEQFIAAVQRGRGDRINNDPLLFSGLVWSGEQAVDKGLVDELANERYVAREVIGAASIVDFTERQDIVEKLSGRIAAVLGQSLQQSFAERLNLPDLH